MAEIQIAVGLKAAISVFEKKWTIAVKICKAHVIAEQYDFKFGLATDSTPRGAATVPIAACAVRSRFQLISRTWR